MSKLRLLVGLPSHTFAGNAESSKRLTITCAHFLARNWRLPFLNQLFWENDVKQHLITSLHERMMRIRRGTNPISISLLRAFDWVLEAGVELTYVHICKVWRAAFQTIASQTKTDFEKYTQWKCFFFVCVFVLLKCCNNLFIRAGRAEPTVKTQIPDQTHVCHSISQYLSYINI